MSAGPAPAATPRDPGPQPAAAPDRVLLGLFLVGAAVSVTLGLFGRLHHPPAVSLHVPLFSGPLEAKVWLACLAAALALVQVVTALSVYGRLGRPRPPAAARVHRWSGRLAFLAATPVALHCLYAIGFGTSGLRVIAHSVLGCIFFGAFTTKMLSLPRRGLPGWALPVLGGTVFTALVGVWATSALWFLTTVGPRW